MPDSDHDRPARRFAVYAGATLALLLEDRPGTLHSTASPGPAGPPRHPFVHAVARDTLSEHDLREQLEAAMSFDDYLARLLAAGFDLLRDDLAAGDLERPPIRLYGSSATPAAAVWPLHGPLHTLAGEELSARAGPAAITVYDAAYAGELLRAHRRARSLAGLLRDLAARGLTPA